MTEKNHKSDLREAKQKKLEEALRNNLLRRKKSSKSQDN